MTRKVNGRELNRRLIDGSWRSTFVRCLIRITIVAMTSVAHADGTATCWNDRHADKAKAMLTNEAVAQFFEQHDDATAEVAAQFCAKLYQLSWLGEEQNEIELSKIVSKYAALIPAEFRLITDKRDLTSIYAASQALALHGRDTD